MKKSLRTCVTVIFWRFRKKQIATLSWCWHYFCSVHNNNFGPSLNVTFFKWSLWCWLKWVMTCLPHSWNWKTPWWRLNFLACPRQVWSFPFALSRQAGCGVNGEQEPDKSKRTFWSRVVVEMVFHSEDRHRSRTPILLRKICENCEYQKLTLAALRLPTSKLEKFCAAMQDSKWRTLSRLGSSMWRYCIG